MTDDRASRSDRSASHYEHRYADPGAVAGFFVDLVRQAGAVVGPGAHVLEVGCANGFMTERLVRAGYRVTAIDISPGMVGEAKARLARTGLRADVRVADVSSFELEEKADVLLAAMWTFYAYVDDVPLTLSRLAPSIMRKVIVDLNPRTHDIARAIDDVREAGFPRTSWRPVAVPQRVRLGRTGRAFLEAGLRLPPVRDLILRRKLNVVTIGTR